MKQLLLNALPTGMDFFSAALGEFHRQHAGAFDSARLGQLSHDLIRAGCEHLWDFRVELQYPPAAASPPPMPGFARLFRHPTRFFFAEVNQVISPGAPPMSCHIASGNEGSGVGLDWSLETMSTPPYAGSSMLYALRRPRALWSRHPELEPFELAERHLRQRDQVFGDLQLEPLRDVSIESYCLRQRELCAARRERAAGADDAQLSWDIRFSGARMAWWGEYERLFPRRVGLL